MRSKRRQIYRNLSIDRTQIVYLVLPDSESSVSPWLRTDYGERINKLNMRVVGSQRTVTKTEVKYGLPSEYKDACNVNKLTLIVLNSA